MMMADGELAKIGRTEELLEVVRKVRRPGDGFHLEKQRIAGGGHHPCGAFNGGHDAFNSLDTVARDSPMLVDSARAIAEAIVVRLGTEADPHWNDKSVQVICAVLVLILLMFKDEDRSLNSLQEICSDPELLKASANKLRELGGIPGRLGSQIMTLFDKDTTVLTKEGAGVVSTITRHLSFLDSELVAKAVATSTFDPTELRKPGITLFLQIPPEYVGGAKGASSLLDVHLDPGNRRCR